ncbi:hypothetical protein CGCF415_v000276 [Colletotrichum fructicola]|uniref:Uncharacterized protein n=1 Tax=Colletotrichum fructicola (strain Nara gc5) TaxID=1213859 RepID=A0A7J6JIL2_COLFN|nr:hypothetical protein CGGC5_v003450 [Colletotrichum fructicola Nara gc5]KAF4906179.1 hypothetical protein CGCFRS4_v000195 [Colletotrichum fructicola]KAF4917048.1 hypothetical protein CGCF415_v000276 [Colletotrichum fructicola]KAF4942245.1 hypothetical protein CGCF245_v000817 [Colletotrichum fructicola]
MYHSQLLIQLVFILREENQGYHEQLKSQTTLEQTHFMSMIAEIQKFREQTLELIQSQAHGTHNVSLSAVSSSQSEIFQQIRGSLLEISARMATVFDSAFPR